MDIDQYDDRHLLCREVAHAWEPGGFDRRPGKAGVARILVCNRCGAERHDIYNALGGVMDQRYNYPLGYRVPGGGLAKADFRRESMRRAGALPRRRLRRVS